MESALVLEMNFLLLTVITGEEEVVVVDDDDDDFDYLIVNWERMGDSTLNDNRKLLKHNKY